ncbi:MAG TPA: MFS transporter [Caulobacteraceae bacterium]
MTADAKAERPTGPEGAAPPARWRELLAPALASRAGLVMLGVWLNAADAMVTATIMPSVARELGGYAWFAWAVAGYLLGSILAGASAGRISERLGLRPAMVLAAGLYAGGCALSAAAPTIGMFLGGRLLQGIGAGWIVGFCYVAIGVVFPERLWARLFGATAGVWGVASLLGPLVGGVFAGAHLWRWAFWMFAAQGLIFAMASLRLLRPPAAGADSRAAGRPLAWRTLSVLALAILAIAAADVTHAGRAAAGLLGAGLALLALAGAVNARPSEGLMPRQAARPATVAGAGYAMIVAMSAASAAFGVYGAAILQVEYAVTPLTAGYVVAVDALGWTLAALFVSGQPDRRHGAWILAGASAILAGVAALALAIGSGRIALIVAAAAVLGIGFGLSWSLATRRILAALPDEDRAIGAAAVPTAQLIGGAVGAAAAGAVANLLGLAHAFTPAHAAALGPRLFAAFIPVAALGWLAALRLARARPPREMR